MGTKEITVVTDDHTVLRARYIDGDLLLDKMPLQEDEADNAWEPISPECYAVYALAILAELLS